MCLYYINSAEKKLRSKMLSNGGTIKVFRAYTVSFSVNGNSVAAKLLSPYMSTPVEIGKDGYVRSNRRTAQKTATEVRDNNVSKGIHCYLDRGDAKNVADGYSRAIVVECEAHVDDLVATDGSHTVFRKLKVDRAQIDKAIVKLAGVGPEAVDASISVKEQNIDSYVSYIKQYVASIESARAEIKELRKQKTVAPTVTLV